MKIIGHSLQLLAFCFLCSSIHAQTASGAVNDMVGWWTGNGSPIDKLGAHNGRWAAQPDYAGAKFGKGFYFSGANNAVILGNPATFRLQTFTIEAWVKRTDATIASYGTIGHAHIFGYGEGGYAFGMKGDGRLFLTKVGFGEIDSERYVDDTEFHHLALTKKHGTVTFYIDGVSEEFLNYEPGFTFETQAAIGARADALDNTFLGVIDEIKIYRRSLSAAEIQKIYQSGPEKPSHPKARYQDVIDAYFSPAYPFAPFLATHR